MKSTLLSISLLLVTLTTFANKKLLTLKTNSTLISIKEGNILYPKVWELAPQLEVDEYVCHPFEGAKQISFISDIDTLSFSVTPNKTYDFVILHKGEKAFTRINTSATKEATMARARAMPYLRKNAHSSSQSDTIPFILGADNRIHIKGSINQSDTIDFLFDTGANACVINSTLVGTKVNVEIDGETLNGGSDGVSTKETSSSNQLKIGNLVWKDATLLSIYYENPSFDAVLGWPAFGGKIVEINYHKNILVIHAKMNDIPKGYTAIPTALIGGIPYINACLTINGKQSKGWFEYDTGGIGSFYLSRKYITQHNIDEKTMPFLRSNFSSGSKGVKFKRNVYSLPSLQFGAFETNHVPIAIAEKDPEGVHFNDILGNHLLKRFNAIIDFEQHQIYLKPNHLINTAYLE